jgi:peptidoglycan hydrolase-like protein with peptidoglycan-binding domain
MMASVFVIVLLAGCGDNDGDGEDGADPVAAAQQQVSRAQNALGDAQASFEDASSTFCDDASQYIASVDRYGGAFSDAEATVGTVRDFGADLEGPEADVRSSADDVLEARDSVAAAEQELAAAEASLAAAQGGTTTAASSGTTTTEPLVDDATVDRVEQAQEDLDAAFEGISDSTPLSEASEQVNAAAFALEIASLRLFADAGCFADDEQREQAVTAVATYTTALQTSLTEAGYYDGEVDGVYGPGTVDAVEQVQADKGLPTTGLVDRATAVALEEAVVAAGGDSATKAIAHTAALQTMLSLAGYWTGPIDGEWSDALSVAVRSLQSDLGVEVAGVVDAATLAAMQDAIEEAATPPATSTTSTSTPTAPASTTTTTTN